MTRTVLSIAYPFAPVDADPIGGAEQVLAALDRALLAAGWRSIVIACEGSTPAGELVSVPRVRGEIDGAERARVHLAVREATSRVMTSASVHLVHLHGVDFAGYLPPPNPPALATLHLPIPWYGEASLRPDRPDTWLLPVSPSQAASAPDDIALLPPIENGVDVENWPRPKRRCAYALCLGRVCPEKGFHLALDAARAADVPLLIAGEVFPYPEHQAYFVEEIAPRLDARRRWLGPITGARKRRLIAAARCVLIPSLVAETSSLVAREAAAAGTPVIAHRIGALVDTVEEGRTGFLVQGAEEMAAAIGRAGEIDAEVCRSVARDRFDRTRMTTEYLALYQRLILPTLSSGPKRSIEPGPQQTPGPLAVQDNCSAVSGMTR